MTTKALPSPVAKDFNTARSQFLELHGSLAVMNTYLKIAVLCLSAVNVGLIVLNVKTYRTFQNPKPLIIRINDVGHAEAINYTSLEYDRPRDPEIRYFLTQFVHDHYSRLRSTAKEDYARSFYFLEDKLAESLIEANKKTKLIESFLAGQGEENDVKVTNVSIEDLRAAPYHATVNFEKVYYGADRQETRREKYVGHFEFIVRGSVPNSFIPINPLGLTITYFREDQAFQP
jgi:type IV secretory pathway component VirB8